MGMAISVVKLMRRGTWQWGEGSVRKVNDFVWGGGPDSRTKENKKELCARDHVSLAEGDGAHATSRVELRGGKSRIILDEAVKKGEKGKGRSSHAGTQCRGMSCREGIGAVQIQRWR